MAKRLRRVPGSRRRQGRRRSAGRELAAARSSLTSLGKSRAGLAATIRAYKERSEESSERFSQLVSASEIAMIRTTTEGLIESWSEAAEKTFGYLSAEVCGRPIALLAAAAEAEQFSPLIEKARGGKIVAGLDVVLLGKDGVAVHASLSVSPARDPQRKIVGALFSARQRRVQGEMTGASLVEFSDDAIVSQTLDGIITGWNKGAEWIYGYRAEEVLRQPISILAPPHKTDESFRILERIARGERVEHYEARRMRKDGKPIVVSVTASPIVDLRGRIVGASAISRDITERRQAHEALLAQTRQLARVNAELELFTSAAAHDLQEPLRKILLLAGRLEGKAQRLEPAALEDIKRIEGAALHMRGLARGLLEYAEASLGKMRLERVNLAASARAVVSELEPRLKAEGARVIIGPPAEVWGDGGQIRRLLGHLLDNALKFRRAKASARVKILCRVRPDGWTEVAVEDNGLGVEPRYREQIFEPFNRLHGHESFEGAGLGLSICRRIMWRHGGTIEVGRAPKSGAAFLALFPPGGQQPPRAA